jgi:hypothetical protein
MAPRRPHHGHPGDGHRIRGAHGDDPSAERGALAVAIAELEQSLASQSAEPPAERLESQLRQLRSLREVYAQQQRLPTWPIDLRMQSVFAAGVVVQLVGFASTTAGLFDKVKLWLGTR